MNKEQIKYNQFWRMGFVAILVALLTLSPCSVRNGIEQSLGLEKTSAVNKIKSAEVKSGTCKLDDAQKSIISSKANPLTFHLALQGNLTFNQILSLVENSFYFSSLASVNRSIKIPFYILYRSFKFHL